MPSGVEAFWARMQVELLNRKKWHTRVELANAMFEYLEIFHNRQRRHSALGEESNLRPQIRSPPLCLRKRRLNRMLKPILVRGPAQDGEKDIDREGTTQSCAGGEHRSSV